VKRKDFRIEWERIMGRQAWTCAELTPKIGLSYRSVRRYLVRSYNARRLDRVKFGRYYFYAVARFLQPPDESYNCARCGKKVDVYRCRCGCEFHICESPGHSRYEYCERQKSTE